jgi:AraC-like DNA-binding protein
MPNDLADAIRRQTERIGGENPFVTDVAGLWLLRADYEKPPSHTISRPSLCVVAQGAKQTSFGGQRYDYRAGQALVVSVALPSVGRVLSATRDEPFLGAVIELDLAVLHEIAAGLEAAAAPQGEPVRSVFVRNFDGPLADCVLRLVRLLDTPSAIRALAPMIQREICYWLLTGPQGREVARATLENSPASGLLHALRCLRDRYADPVRVADLASLAGMSASAFHRQFKQLTAMTPLQYQKQLRLLEARRLMASEAANVQTAAFAVGYESASQFSREYARMFGAPPKRDARLAGPVLQVA